MGGLGSGRSGGRPTTDDGFTLSLSTLLGDRLFRSGCAWSGSIMWMDTRTGEQVGSIGYEAYLCQESGRVRLKYTPTRRDGKPCELDYWIQLATTPQPFGGRRWWSVCPRAGRRAAKLYLPNGASTFASRQAYGLAYACQREPPMIGPRGVLPSFGASSEGRAASTAIFPNRSGCARQPTTASRTP